jgi:hypothetical protein
MARLDRAIHLCCPLFFSVMAWARPRHPSLLSALFLRHWPGSTAPSVFAVALFLRHGRPDRAIHLCCPLSFSVMAGLGPAIHDFSFSRRAKNSWMARPSRAMTNKKNASSPRLVAWQRFVGLA